MNNLCGYMYKPVSADLFAGRQRPSGPTSPPLTLLTTWVV